MSFDRREGLLPENIELDFNGKKLSVVNKINEGATAEIFTGKLEISENELVDVAIKVLNPDGFHFSERDFLEEIITLRFLFDYETQENKETKTDFFIAPHFYGKSDYKGTSYYVMELIKGTRISEIIASMNTLSEKQSLIIAWNLFRTIHILHTKLDKSYIDLKFNDFWWEEKENKWGGQLKLTDFGSMDPIRGDNSKIQRDVLKCSVLFFQMLSGYSLSFNSYGLKERADKLINNLEISWGTRNLLQKMLHRNHDFHYRNTEEIVNKLYNLAQDWIISEDELFKNAQERIAILDSKDGDEYSTKEVHLAWLVKAALDIWLIRTDQPKNSVEAMLYKINKILKTTDDLENGIKFFEMREFDLSKANFLKAINFSQKIISAHRWLLLSESVRELPSNEFAEVKNEVSRISELMDQEDYSHAIIRLERLKSKTSSNYLQQLIHEANFYQEYQKALTCIKTGDYFLAAENLKRAEEWLGKIPYADLILDEEGSIQDKLEEIEKIRDTRGISEKLILDVENLIKQNAWEQILPKIEEIYINSPNGIENLATFINFSKKAFQSRRFYESFRISEFGLRIQKNKKELIEQKNLACTFLIGESYFHSQDYIRLLDYIVRKINLLVKADESEQILTRWLRFIIKEAVDNHNLMALKDADLVINKIDLLNKTNLREIFEVYKKIIQEKDLRDEKAEELIKEASAYLNFDRSTSSLLKTIRNNDLIYQVSIFSNEVERLNFADKYLDHAAELIEAPEKQKLILKLKNSIKKERASIEARKTKITDLANSIQKTYSTDILNRFKEINLSKYQNISSKLDEILRNQIEELLKDCFYYLNTINHTEESIEEIIVDLCQFIDLKIPRLWNSLFSNLENDNKEIALIFDRVKLDLENCNTENALVELNKIITVAFKYPEWLEYKNKVLIAYAFQKFINENEKIIKDNIPNHDLYKKIRTYSALKLPSKYWEKSSLRRYIQVTCKKTKNDLFIMSKEVEDKDFLNLLNLCLDAERTSQIFFKYIPDRKGASDDNE